MSGSEGRGEAGLPGPQVHCEGGLPEGWRHEGRSNDESVGDLGDEVKVPGSEV